jgi:hypothetical protein
MRTNAKERVQAGLLPLEFAGEPGSNVRVLSSPELLHIIVCGDPYRNRVMVMEGGHTQPTTRPLRLPSNWVELLAHESAKDPTEGIIKVGSANVYGRTWMNVIICGARS